MLAVNSYISAESGEADSKAVFSVWPSKGRPQEATAPVVRPVTQWKKSLTWSWKSCSVLGKATNFHLLHRELPCMLF